MRERPIGLMMVDADNLKEVNDRYGHTLGNQVIRAVAEGIRRSIRSVGEALYASKRAGRNCVRAFSEISETARKTPVDRGSRRDPFDQCRDKPRHQCQNQVGDGI